VAFVIISHSSWGVVALVWEQVAALGSSAASLVVVPVASIPGCGVDVLGGLVGLESQGHGLVPHPVVGGVIRPSRRAVFRRWDAVPIVTAWQCCLVYAELCRDGACPGREDRYLLSPSGVSQGWRTWYGSTSLRSPKGPDGGEVVRCYEACGRRRRERSWLTARLRVRPRSHVAQMGRGRWASAGWAA
jgi:hypothetical protein